MTDKLTRPQDEMAAALGQPWVQKIAANLARPGSFEIISQAAAEAGLHAGSRVFVVRNGRGSSAVHLAKTIGCRVSALVADADDLTAVRDLARREGVARLVSLTQGTVTPPYLWPESDAVLLECVLSTMREREEIVKAAAAALAPQGSLIIADIAAEGDLPEGVREFLAATGFSRQAPSLSGYADLARSGGLSPEPPHVFPQVLPAYLQNLAGEMSAASFAVELGLVPINKRAFSKIKETLAIAQGLADEGAMHAFFLQARLEETS